MSRGDWAAALTDRRRADARLHIEIAATAQSPRLTREEMDLWSEIGDLVWLPMEGAGVAPAARDHDQLIDAIEAHAPGRAREIAERHVAAETDRLLDLRLSLHHG